MGQEEASVYVVGLGDLQYSGVGLRQLDTRPVRSELRWWKIQKHTCRGIFLIRHEHDLPRKEKDSKSKMIAELLAYAPTQPPYHHS